MIFNIQSLTTEVFEKCLADAVLNGDADPVCGWETVLDVDLEKRGKGRKDNTIRDFLDFVNQSSFPSVLPFVIINEYLRVQFSTNVMKEFVEVCQEDELASTIIYGVFGESIPPNLKSGFKAKANLNLAEKIKNSNEYSGKVRSW